MIDATIGEFEYRFGLLGRGREFPEMILGLLCISVYFIIVGSQFFERNNAVVSRSQVGFERIEEFEAEGRVVRILRFR